MKASKRQTTISKPMLVALKLLREHPLRSTEDFVKLGFTYAALTGLERRKLATWRSDGMYAITMDGTEFLMAFEEQGSPNWWLKK